MTSSYAAPSPLIKYIQYIIKFVIIFIVPNYVYPAHFEKLVKIIRNSKKGNRYLYIGHSFTNRTPFRQTHFWFGWSFFTGSIFLTKSVFTVCKRMSHIQRILRFIIKFVLTTINNTFTHQESKRHLYTEIVLYLYEDCTISNSTMLYSNLTILKIVFIFCPESQLAKSMNLKIKQYFLFKPINQ